MSSAGLAVLVMCATFSSILQGCDSFEPWATYNFVSPCYAQFRARIKPLCTQAAAGRNNTTSCPQRNSTCDNSTECFLNVPCGYLSWWFAPLISAAPQNWAYLPYTACPHEPYPCQPWSNPWPETENWFW